MEWKKIRHGLRLQFQQWLEWQWWQEAAQGTLINPNLILAFILVAFAEASTWSRNSPGLHGDADGTNNEQCFVSRLESSARWQQQWLSHAGLEFELELQRQQWQQQQCGWEKAQECTSIIYVAFFALVLVVAILEASSWSRKQPSLLVRAGNDARCGKRLFVSAPWWR